MHPENEIPHKISRPFQHKVYYEGNTNEKNCNTDDSQSDNDYLVRNLKKEQDYKGYGECKEYSFMVAKEKEFKLRKSKVEQAQI